MSRLKRSQGPKQSQKEDFLLQPTHCVTQWKILLWSPQETVGMHPQWAQICATGLDTALNYLREIEPLALEPQAVTKNNLHIVPCENSPLVMVQSVHMTIPQQHSSSLRTNPASEQIVQKLLDPLREREMDILRLLALGYSNQGIADSLIIEVSTVKWYLKQIYSKLNVHSRTQAVAYGRQSGLLP